MRAEDLIVQRQLIEAGYGARIIDCRGGMYEALEQILAEDPQREGFVDQLRTISSAAGILDRQAVLEQASTEHQGVKACPDCGQRPDLDYLVNSTNEIYVSCTNHQEGAIAVGGATLSAAIEKWNRDDWFPRPGERFLFQL